MTSSSSWVPGLLGGLAATTASVITHPMDSIKVRMYLYGEGQANQIPSLSLARHILKTEGVRAFYRGITATIMRQGIFSTIRFATNDFLQSAFLTVNSERADTAVWQKVASSALAGCVGAAAACPADTVLVRMQADGKLPAHLRRNYRNVFDGLVRIVREEGMWSLFRGVSPVIVRGCCVTAAQFTTYDLAKSMLIRTGYFDGSSISTHLVASTLAGIVTTLIVNPVDVIKARIMHSKAASVAAAARLSTGSNSGPPSGGAPAQNEAIFSYRSAADCTSFLIKTEGVAGLYKGLAANFLRQCPQVVLMWVCYEQYVKVYLATVQMYYSAKDKRMAVAEVAVTSTEQAKQQATPSGGASGGVPAPTPTKSALVLNLKNSDGGQSTKLQTAASGSQQPNVPATVSPHPTSSSGGSWYSVSGWLKWLGLHRTSA